MLKILLSFFKGYCSKKIWPVLIRFQDDGAAQKELSAKSSDLTNCQAPPFPLFLLSCSCLARYKGCWWSLSLVEKNNFHTELKCACYALFFKLSPFLSFFFFMPKQSQCLSKKPLGLQHLAHVHKQRKACHSNASPALKMDKFSAVARCNQIQCVLHVVAGVPQRCLPQTTSWTS